MGHNLNHNSKGKPVVLKKDYKYLKLLHPFPIVGTLSTAHPLAHVVSPR